MDRVPYFFCDSVAQLLNDEQQMYRLMGILRKRCYNWCAALRAHRSNRVNFTFRIEFANNQWRHELLSVDKNGAFSFEELSVSKKAKFMRIDRVDICETTKSTACFATTFHNLQVMLRAIKKFAPSPAVKIGNVRRIKKDELSTIFSILEDLQIIACLTYAHSKLIESFILRRMKSGYLKELNIHSKGWSHEFGNELQKFAMQPQMRRLDCLQNCDLVIRKRVIEYLFRIRSLKPCPRPRIYDIRLDFPAKEMETMHPELQKHKEDGVIYWWTKNNTHIQAYLVHSHAKIKIYRI
ncbi:hypothetical protein QR680_000236 [Steinernema hermaphroditum]|uniref:Uncharacterized protein n=1 Tax=Steinernema hermaphroditum TaxID=289476 RepID=A0AA39GTY1_9BILA|nr:hypothetical protein QR680_000236 [Steinernema hermaphroditum]